MFAGNSMEHGANTLITQRNSAGSSTRWRDSMWLAWLAVPLYWIQPFEEYSLPVIGLDYSIHEMICKNLGFPPYPDCPIPLAFYPVVNIALMWFGRRWRRTSSGATSSSA